MIPALNVYDSSFGEEDVLVGTCRFGLRRGKVSCSFSYADSYLAMPEAYEIEPAAALRESSYHFEGMPCALRDSSPDRWGRHLIDRRNIEQGQAEASFPRTFDEVDYLIGVCDASRQGSLRLSAPGDVTRLSSSEEIPPIVQIGRLLAAANDVASGNDGKEYVKELLDAGSASLGGARPKASVLDSGKLLMAKFSHPEDEWNVMAWEKTALDIAAAAGICTPRARLVEIGKSTVLVLERFDRERSLLRGRRIPYLSAMSLVDSRDGDSCDYTDVADALSAWAHDAANQLAELFKRVVLSVALHNTDDHLRNLGFLRKHGKWCIAPAFDLNINPDINRLRATSIYGEAGASEVAALKDLALVCGVPKEHAAKIVESVVKPAETWRHFAKRNGCKDSEMSLLGRVVDVRCGALRREFGL